ncbi:MAG: hypothetical protein AAF998_19430 [Bacteroidota bacterium]
MENNLTPLETLLVKCVHDSELREAMTTGSLKLEEYSLTGEDLKMAKSLQGKRGNPLFNTLMNVGENLLDSQVADDTAPPPFQYVFAGFAPVQLQTPQGWYWQNIAMYQPVPTTPTEPPLEDETNPEARTAEAEATEGEGESTAAK